MTVDVDREQPCQQKSRTDPGGEQRDDRGIRGDAVDDHRDRRRDEVVERAAGGDQRRCETLAIAGLAHARIGERADRGGCRRGHA